MAPLNWSTVCRLTLLLASSNVLTEAVDIQPFGVANGDILMIPADDAFEEIPILGSVRLPFLDRLYDRFFVSTNGYVSFEVGIRTYTPETFPMTGPIMLSAFWSDIDTQQCDDNKIYYRQDTNQAGSLLTSVTAQIRELLPQYRRYQAKWSAVVTYHRVRRFTSECASPRNTFQIILTTDGNQAFGIFNYVELGWIEHSERFANAGFNAGDGAYFYEIPGARSEEFASISNRSNVGVPGLWIFKLDKQKIEDSTCDHSRKAISYVAPRYGSIFGGTEVLIGGVCSDLKPEEVADKVENITCKFANVVVSGERQQDSAVRCVAPALAGKGTIPLRVSVDGGLSYPYVSEYYYDPAIYNIQLIRRRDWTSQGNTRQISLAWDPVEIDNSENLTNSYIDVDFFGWYVTSQGPVNGVRMIYLSLAQTVPNTGHLKLLISKVHFDRAEVDEAGQIFLNGAFRIVKTDDRRKYYNPTSTIGWSKTVPMIWSSLTDMDVFTGLKAPAKPATYTVENDTITISGPSDGLIGQTVTYQNNKGVYPLVGQRALAAMTSVKSRFESILLAEQWRRYYSSRRERLQLAEAIAKCHHTRQSFCDCWSEKERTIIRYNLDDAASFPPCPPSANHARLDRGRFAPKSSLVSPATCNKNPVGSTFWDVGPCDEHPGAVLCVNGLSVNRQEIQQQCCYSDGGNLMDARLAPGGGRVQFLVQHNRVGPLNGFALDQGVVWLAERVEEQLIDRKPQEVCCPRGGNWNTKECLLFRKTRSGGSAQNYQPPVPPGGGFGDPHIWTLDGLRYTFNGLGEYVLVELHQDNVTIQGRTAKVAVPIGQTSRATVWSGLAFRVGNTTVQFSLGTREGLNVFLNGARLDVTELSNVIETDDALIYLDRNGTSSLRKISARLSTGIMIDLEDVDSVIQFLISLPSELANVTTRGLLGVWNGNATDDLLPRNSDTPLSANASNEVIFHNFGQTWKVSRNESLFTYQSPTETYDTVNDPNFRPEFGVPQVPVAIAAEADRICGGNSECLFDIAMTGNLTRGRDAALFIHEAAEVAELLSVKVVSCGFPNITSSYVSIINGSSYNANDTVEYECLHEDSSIVVVQKSGSTMLRCSEDGVWLGEPLVCAVYCGPPNVTSSDVLIKQGTSYYENDVVQFTCSKKSLYKSGDLIVVCTDRGTWTGKPVICSSGRRSAMYSWMLLSLVSGLLFMRVRCFK